MANKDFRVAVRSLARRFLTHYGMILALLVLCLYYSWATLTLQHEEGAPAARRIAGEMIDVHSRGDSVLVLAGLGKTSEEFVENLSTRLEEAGLRVATRLNGNPQDIRRALEEAAAGAGTIRAIAVDKTTSELRFLQDLAERFPDLAGARVHRPGTYHWPVFLKANNLLNIADQITVIAIIAIGMTMVIITAGIDLSVGSLIALSSVVCAWIIREAGGESDATAMAMAAACLGAIAACGLVGAFSGFMITRFAMPAFIVTLAMMLVCRGLGFIISGGETIYDIPDRFVMLAQGKALLGIPNGVVLMLVLYVLAHLMMSRMRIGRYIYATGGNAQAARLSGLPVKRVLLFVYTACGALAGLGGVLTASLLKSGDPKNGVTHELYIIAAVVIGGTSLFGGEGRIFGTLIGAFIIAVIRNGMNLTNVESYTQNVILGMAVLGAVLLDRLKKRV